MSKEPTIFIVEDDKNFSTTLRLLFESIQLNVESFPDGPAYLKKHDPDRPGCLLIDMYMPKMSGLELQETLIKQNNPLPIIFMSGHSDVLTAVRAIKAGAVDFITKPFHSQLLIETVQKVIRNTECKQKILISEINPRLEKLTQRENDVMKLMIDGKLNKEIACILNISTSTVELHRANVMQKMEVESLAELVKLSLPFFNKKPNQARNCIYNCAFCKINS